MDALKGTTPAQKESVNRWFQVLETKKALANISTRMCMTIENLIDLRLNRWKKHSKAGHLKSIDTSIKEATNKAPPKKQIKILQRGADASSQEPPEAAAAAVAVPPKAMDLDRRAKATLEEYLHLRDVGELMACIKSWEGLDEFFDALFSKLVDCGDKEREALLDLIPQLRGLTPMVTVEKAIGRTFEFLEDVLIDAPRADKHLAAAAASAMATGVCSCAIFAQPNFAAVPNKAEWLSGVVTAAVAHTSDAAFLEAFAAQLKAIWPKVQPLVGGEADALIPKLKAALPGLVL